jgi:hypothetical protein
MAMAIERLNRVVLSGFGAFGGLVLTAGHAQRRPRTRPGAGAMNGKAR